MKTLIKNVLSQIHNQNADYKFIQFFNSFIKITNLADSHMFQRHFKKTPNKPHKIHELAQ